MKRGGGAESKIKAFICQHKIIKDHNMSTNRGSSLRSMRVKGERWGAKATGGQSSRRTVSTKTSTRTHTPTAKTWKKKKKKQAKKKWKCCVCCALNENGEWWQNEQRTARNVCHKSSSSSSSISSESVGQTWNVIDRTGEEAAQASWGLLMGQVEGGAAKGCPNWVVSDSW